jgi:hypothetical protein
MPAEDHYHGTVMRAVSKEGWTVTDQQVSLSVGERRLWVDIRAIQSNGDTVILIEVKGFAAPSNVNSLANAIGQYMLYKVALKYIGSQERLFLAAPLAAYNGILSEPLGEWTLHELNIDLLVFDPDKEEIVEWITR